VFHSVRFVVATFRWLTLLHRARKDISNAERWGSSQLQYPKFLVLLFDIQIVKDTASTRCPASRQWGELLCLS
jgi:hypothetical protein